eukprot:9488456-Pyramimonas_sp.AAC.2
MPVVPMQHQIPQSPRAARRSFEQFGQDASPRARRGTFHGSTKQEPDGKECQVSPDSILSSPPQLKPVSQLHNGNKPPRGPFTPASLGADDVAHVPQPPNQGMCDVANTTHLTRR